MPHLSYLDVENFKLFQQKQAFTFKALTLLTGTNSSGKTSVIQALRLLSNYLGHKDQYANRNNSVAFSLAEKLSLDHIGERLGDFSKLVNYHNNDSGHKSIKFCIPCQLQGILDVVHLTLTITQSGQVLYEGELTGVSIDALVDEANILTIQKKESTWLVNVNYWYLWQEFKREFKEYTEYTDTQRKLNGLKAATEGEIQIKDWTEEGQSLASEMRHRLEEKLNKSYPKYDFDTNTSLNLADRDIGYRQFFHGKNNAISMPSTSRTDPFFNFSEKAKSLEKEELIVLLDEFYQLINISLQSATDFLTKHHYALEELNDFIEEYVEQLNTDEQQGTTKKEQFFSQYVAVFDFSIQTMHWEEAHKLLLEQFCFVYTPAKCEEPLPAILELLSQPYSIVEGWGKTATFQLESRLDKFLKWMGYGVTVDPDRDEDSYYEFDENHQRLPFFDELFFKDFISSNISSALQVTATAFSRIGYLSSIRNIVKRAYGNRREETEFNSHILEFLELGIEKHEAIINFINQHIKLFEIGERIAVERDNEGISNRVYVIKGNRKVLLADLGYGISQFMPILLKIAIQASRNHHASRAVYAASTMCVEEPETNLHPALQSKLADLFVEASEQFNIQFIIETHSEYLIRKLQYLTVNKRLQPQNVLLYYFEKQDDEGERKVREIYISNDGSLSNDFGEGFFDEADKIAICVWNLNQSQKN